MPDSILFDMDGVLVDTSTSYLRAILATARKFTASSGDLPERWLRPEIVATLKAASGFNNDWHLTEALVLLARAPVPHGDANRLPTTLAEAAAHDTGLPGVRALLGQPAGPLPDTTSMPPIVRSFQSAYLGRELMERLHPEATFDADFAAVGYIRTERRLADPLLVARAAEGARLAIATGRPREEALFALAFHGFDHFAAVVSHDDVREEQLRRPHAGPLGKPSPWPLLEALRRIGGEVPRCLGYLGDLPDDMRAAVAAGVPGLGIRTEASAEALRRAGAMRTFGSTDDALNLLVEPLRA